MCMEGECRGTGIEGSKRECFDGQQVFEVLFTNISRQGEAEQGSLHTVEALCAVTTDAQYYYFFRVIRHSYTHTHTHTHLY